MFARLRSRLSGSAKRPVYAVRPRSSIGAAFDTISNVECLPQTSQGGCANDLQDTCGISDGICFGERLTPPRHQRSQPQIYRITDNGRLTTMRESHTSSPQMANQPKLNRPPRRKNQYGNIRKLPENIYTRMTTQRLPGRNDTNSAPIAQRTAFVARKTVPAAVSTARNGGPAQRDASASTSIRPALASQKTAPAPVAQKSAAAAQKPAPAPEAQKLTPAAQKTASIVPQKTAQAATGTARNTGQADGGVSTSKTIRPTPAVESSAAGSQRPAPVKAHPETKTPARPSALRAEGSSAPKSARAPASTPTRPAQQGYIFKEPPPPSKYACGSVT